MKTKTSPTTVESSVDSSPVSLEQCYQKAWLLEGDRLLLQSKDGAAIYDIEKKKVMNRLKGVSLPISDYVLLSQNTLLTTDQKGLVQIWKACGDAETVTELQPVDIQVSRFKITCLAKHTDNQFIVAGLFNKLSIWCVDTQEKVYEYKFPFSIIKSSSSDPNVLNLIGMDAKSYKKVRLILDKEHHDVLWETHINWIVDNLDIIGVIDDAEDKMTILRKKETRDADNIIWLEKKNKSGEATLLSIKPDNARHNKTDDTNYCVTTVSRNMPYACFFYPHQRTARIESLTNSPESSPNTFHI